MAMIDLIIIHRLLGSTDESASDEEQAEKILYFRSNQELSVGQQLSMLTMIEGLIEFTTKFSKQSIQSAVLDRKIWCFYECEPETWIVASFPITPSSGSAAPAANHKSLFAYLVQFYHCYFIVSGRIQDRLDMAYLSELQGQRKRIRKRKQQIQNLAHDLRVTEDIVHDIFDDCRDTKTLPAELADLFAEHKACTLQLIEMLQDKRYTVASIRNHLAGYIIWYTSFANASDGSFISGFPKLTNPLTGSNSSRVALVTRTLRVLKEVLGDLLVGTMMIHDGGMLWSDFDSFFNNHMLHMVNLLDALHNVTLRDMAEDFLTRGSAASTPVTPMGRASSYRVEDNEEMKKDLKIKMVQDLLADRLSRQGVALTDWKTLSIDNAAIDLLHAEDSAPSPSSSAKHRFASIVSFLQGVSTGDGKERILMPTVYTSQTATAIDGEVIESNTRRLGKAIYVLCGRLVVMVVLDEDKLPAFQREEILYSLSHYSKNSSNTLVSLSRFQQTMARLGTPDDEPVDMDEPFAADEQSAKEMVFSDGRVLSIQLTLLCQKLVRSLHSDVFKPYKKCITSSIEPLFSNIPQPAKGLTRNKSVTVLGSAGGGSNKDMSKELNSAAWVIVCGAHDTVYLHYTKATNAVQILSVKELLDMLTAAQTETTSGKGSADILDVLIKKYAQMRNPHALFFHVIAAVFGKPTVRAMNSLWQQIRDRICTDTKSAGDVLLSSHSSLCQRVCTAQRGGHWVIAHKLHADHVHMQSALDNTCGSMDTILLAGVKGCATINDLNDVAEALVREVRLLQL